MKRVLIVERLVLLTGMVAMAFAVGAFDWRLGLFFAGAFAFASSLDIPWRRT